MAEVDRMNREGNALVNDYKALIDRSRDLALAPEIRAQAEAAAKEKIEAIKEKKREVTLFVEGVRRALPNFQPARLQVRPASSGTESDGMNFKPGASENGTIRLGPVESVPGAPR